MPSKKRTGWARGSRRYEAEYLRRMRAITNALKQRLKTIAGDNYNEVMNVAAEFERYGESLRPYAERIANQMLSRVNISSAKDLLNAAEDVVGQAKYQYIKRSYDLSRNLGEQLANPNDPITERYRQLLAEQVDLITSLPKKAAEDMQAYATELLSSGARVSQEKINEYTERVKKKAAAEGDISFFIGNKAENRAKMIARTEVSRASTLLTQSRAEHIGSTGYVWRTSNDAIVRDTHRDLNGEFIRWDSPPEADPGLFYHAGSGPNCRCTCEVVLAP